MNKFLEAIQNQNYFENFITRSVKSSNAIEGNTLSYAETYSIIFVMNHFLYKMLIQKRYMKL